MAKISPVGSNMTVLHGKKYDLDESKKDPAKQIAEALNIMLKGKSLNESRFTQTDFGTVEYMGKRYTLKNQADFTNRLLPGNFVNYHDAERGEEFDFEMAADATSESGEDCTVYWIFSHTKGESDSDWDSFDYTDVDRVVCGPLEDEDDLDESMETVESTEDEYVDLDEGDMNESKKYSGNDFLVFDNGSETMDRYTIILKDDEDNEDSRGMIPVLISGEDPRGISGHEEIRLNDLLNKLYVPDDASEEDIKDAEEFLGKEIDFSTLPEAVQKFVLNDYNSRDLDLDESSKLNEATSKDWTGQDVIESRDIIERLDELESDEDSLDDNDKEELEVLREFKNAFGDHDDWKHGIAIINRSYFVEHVKELLADIGIPENLENFPSYIAIDWDATANNIERDYSSYDINGTEFLARD